MKFQSMKKSTLMLLGGVAVAGTLFVGTSTVLATTTSGSKTTAVVASGIDMHTLMNDSKAGRAIPVQPSSPKGSHAVAASGIDMHTLMNDSKAGRAIPIQPTSR